MDQLVEGQTGKGGVKGAAGASGDDCVEMFEGISSLYKMMAPIRAPSTEAFAILCLLERPLQAGSGVRRRSAEMDRSV